MNLAPLVIILEKKCLYVDLKLLESATVLPIPIISAPSEAHYMAEMVFKRGKMENSHVHHIINTLHKVFIHNFDI